MKKTSSKIMNLKRLGALSNTILIVVFALATLSCSKNDASPPELSFNEIPQGIKDLIYFSGEETAATVVITVPGGPSTEFATDLVDNFAPAFSPKGILTVTVHQA